MIEKLDMYYFKENDSDFRLGEKLNEIIEALNAEKLEPRIERSCGCVKCICEDEERCHGCGSHECQYHQDIRLERDKLKESGKLSTSGMEK